MSHCLAERGIDHVVLERGEVANSWRTERWDSLRLLTPNWQSRLPGYAYEGDDPDGYRNMEETIAFIAGYAGAVGVPVETGTNVTRVSKTDTGFSVQTDRGDWQRRAVVLQGCTSSPLFELNVTVPVGAQADVVIPTRLLGVDPRAKTTSLAEGGRLVPADVDANGDVAVAAVGSGSYAFVLSAA